MPESPDVGSFPYARGRAEHWSCSDGGQRPRAGPHGARSAARAAARNRCAFEDGSFVFPGAGDQRPGFPPPSFGVAICPGGLGAWGLSNLGTGVQVSPQRSRPRTRFPELPLPTLRSSRTSPHHGPRCTTARPARSHSVAARVLLTPPALRLWTPAGGRLRPSRPAARPWAAGRKAPPTPGRQDLPTECAHARETIPNMETGPAPPGQREAPASPESCQPPWQRLGHPLQEEREQNDFSFQQVGGSVEKRPQLDRTCDADLRGMRTRLTQKPPRGRGRARAALRGPESENRAFSPCPCVGASFPVRAPGCPGPGLASTWTLQNPQPRPQPTTREPALPAAHDPRARSARRAQRENDPFLPTRPRLLSLWVGLRREHRPQPTSHTLVTPGWRQLS